MAHTLLLALQTPVGDQWIHIAFLLVVIALIWIAVRFIFRIAMRAFTLGCGAIVLLGLILAALRFLN